MTAMSATPVTSVLCPPWCNVSQSTHLRELRWEGRAVHWSDARAGEGWEIRHTTATDAQGDAEAAAAQVYVSTRGGLTLAAAEELALTLLAAYEEVAG